MSNVQTCNLQELLSAAYEERWRNGQASFLSGKKMY